MVNFQVVTSSRSRTKSCQVADAARSGNTGFCQLASKYLVDYFGTYLLRHRSSLGRSGPSLGLSKTANLETRRPDTLQAVAPSGKLESLL
jgi:hypothetical protein